MFDDQGLTEADRKMRGELEESLGLTSDELRGLTQWLSHWHKDWGAVLRACQKDFNTMRRMQCADDEGYCVCVSTGEWQHYTKMDAGHFIGADRPVTRFNPRNVWPQTKKANNHKHGDDAKINYTLWMCDRFGVEAIRELQELSKHQKQWHKCQRELFIHRIHWRQEIKNQEARLNPTKAKV